MKNLVSIIIPVLHFSKPLNFKHLVGKRPKTISHLLSKPRGIRDLIKDIVDSVTLNYEIIVVCNSEKNEKLVNFIRSNRYIQKYCINSVNVGVSRSWNMGAMMAEGEYLCYINDDVEIGKGCLESLFKVLKENDDVGQVGPKGGKWEGNQSGPRVGLEKIEGADEISGFLFMMKREVFDLVNGFDVAYTPAGCEEIDMSFKIRNKGYKCLVVPHLHAIHHSYRGVSSLNTDIHYLNKVINTKELDKRNKKIFLSKWGNKEGCKN